MFRVYFGSPLSQESETHMATSVTLTSVQLPPGGSVYVNFSDGTQLEFTDRAGLISNVENIINTDWAKMALLSYWYLHNTALDNPAIVNGKTLQVDMSLNLNQLSIGVV